MFNGSLPDGVFSGNLTVNVTARNRFGQGSPSIAEELEISMLSTYCMYMNKCIHHTYIFT